MRGLRLATHIVVVALLAGCADDPTASRTGAPPAGAQPEGFAASGEVRTGWIHGPGGDPLEVTFEVIDGRAIFEGDIDLGPADAIPATREALVGPEGQRRGVIIDGSSRRWTSGSVAYEISTSFNSTQRQTILNAISYVQATTPGVSFYQKGSYTSDYIRFTLHSSLCNSSVGRTGGRQDVNLTSGCAYSRGSVIHEILHALGMWHEQSRCNRDTYVEILWNNVESGKSHNFDKHCTGATDVPNNRYDEGSIMHYGPYAFSANGQPTIRSRRGLDYLMGQRSGMSGDDVYTIDWMYPPPITNLSVTYPGGTPAISWGAARTAVAYDVYLVETESYQSQTDRWEREDRTFVGTTTGTSIQDGGSTYTGQDYCDYGSFYEAWEFEYRYEVVARYESGLTKARSVRADVARCY